MFPSNGFVTRRPLPSTGSLGVVPRLRRYYEALRLPSVPLAALRCLRLAIPSFRPLFIPTAQDVRLRFDLELVMPVSAGSCDGDGRGSQVPGDPSCALALFSDPGGTRHACHNGVLARPPWLTRTTAPAMIFRGSIARPKHLLSTLRSGSHLPPRKTRFRLLARLSRAGFVNPQGSNERFLSSSLFLLSQASWRNVSSF
jgi:hypothetical protein